VIYKSIFSFSPGWRDLGNLVNLLFSLRVFFLPLRVIYKSIFFSPGWRDLGNLVNLLFRCAFFLYSRCA